MWYGGAKTFTSASSAVSMFCKGVGDKLIWAGLYFFILKCEPICASNTVSPVVATSISTKFMYVSQVPLWPMHAKKKYGCEPTQAKVKSFFFLLPLIKKMDMQYCCMWCVSNFSSHTDTPSRQKSEK